MLGTVINAKLTFEVQVAACASKASIALTGVRLLSSARGFLRRRHTAQLVRAIMAEPVHRAALVTITGAYKSAATDAMEVEANLLPLRLRLRAAVARLGLRAAAAHPRPPLAKRLALPQVDPHPAHPAPLHHAVRNLAPHCPPLHRFETLLPHVVAPWVKWPKSLVIEVANSKDEATASHARLLESLGANDVVAYTDGSLMEGVAASGVVQFTLTAWRAALNIYNTELEGLHIATSCAPLLLLADYLCTLRVLADNKAAVTDPIDARPRVAKPSV
ncbi:hypothetical protein JCM3774_005811 [Rhodotorula dairenensis]